MSEREARKAPLKQKILFLEDGSVTARRLKRALTANGRVCVEAGDERALREHLNAGVDIVVHVPTDPRKFSAAIARATKDHDQIPFLHVIEEALFVQMTMGDARAIASTIVGSS